MSKMSATGLGKIGVLAGGPSNEREIRLKSGRAVYDALVTGGVLATKLTFRGIANDEPLPNIDTKDQLNRRVTFKVVASQKQ